MWIMYLLASGCQLLDLTLQAERTKPAAQGGSFAPHRSNWAKADTLSCQGGEVSPCNSLAQDIPRAAYFHHVHLFFSSFLLDCLWLLPFALLHGGLAMSCRSPTTWPQGFHLQGLLPQLGETSSLVGHGMHGVASWEPRNPLQIHPNPMVYPMVYQAISDLFFFVTSQFTKAKSEPWLCCTRWHKMRPLSIPDVKWSFCTGTVEVCSFCWCLHNWYPVHLSNYRSSSVPSSTMFDYSNVLGLFMAFPHKQFRTCKKNLLSFPLFPLPLCVSGLQAAACIGSSEQLHCLESSPSILFGSLSSCWSMLYINVYYA